MSSSKIFFFLNPYKVTLQHLLNVFVLFKTVSFIEINLKLKIDIKMFTFKNLEEIWKTWKNFEKTSGNPAYKKFVRLIFLSISELWLEKYSNILLIFLLFLFTLN